MPDLHGGTKLLDAEALLAKLGVSEGMRIADLGVGHRDHLAFVGRVGQNFLVAGHRGVENHLSGALAFRAAGLAL